MRWIIRNTFQSDMTIYFFPEEALTNTTRLRWWQPFVISNGLVVPGVERAQWALDNILIGWSGNQSQSAG